MEGDTADTPTLFPASVGEKLRKAREAQNLQLAEIAARTRIPQRHLEAIENSDYTGLPSVTYALGFAKAYARAVGADEVDVARALRAELGDNPERAAPTPSYEMNDPARVPPRGLAWAGVLVALLVLIGVGLWYGTNLFRGSPPPEKLAITDGSTGDPGNAAAPAAAAPATGGQVSLVALDTVWLRVTDAGGKRLFEKELAAGERYEVPADAQGPRVRTGRPDRLQVLINGSNAPPLGSGSETVDVAVSAAALQARGQDGAPAPSATTATAAAGSSTTGSSTAGRATRRAPRATPTAQAAPASVETPAGNALATP